MTPTPQQRAEKTLVAFDAARKVLRGLSDDVALCDFFETEWQVETILEALRRMADETEGWLPIDSFFQKVMDMRGSYDAPGFDACLNAEMISVGHVLLHYKADDESRIAIGRFRYNASYPKLSGWAIGDSLATIKPKHWMPLPAAPEQDSKCCGSVGMEACLKYDQEGKDCHLHPAPLLAERKEALDIITKPKERIDEFGGDYLVLHDKDIEIVKAALKQRDPQGLVVALRKIASRPDLPNPERDADWKNCMKWSAHEAQQALADWENK